MAAGGRFDHHRSHLSGFPPSAVAPPQNGDGPTYLVVSTERRCRESLGLPARRSATARRRNCGADGSRRLVYRHVDHEDKTLSDDLPHGLVTCFGVKIRRKWVFVCSVTEPSRVLCRVPPGENKRYRPRKCPVEVGGHNIGMFDGWVAWPQICPAIRPVKRRTSRVPYKSLAVSSKARSICSAGRDLRNGKAR